MRTECRDGRVGQPKLYLIRIPGGVNGAKEIFEVIMAVDIPELIPDPTLPIQESQETIAK